MREAPNLTARLDVFAKLSYCFAAFLYIARYALWNRIGRVHMCARVSRVRICAGERFIFCLFCFVLKKFFWFFIFFSIFVIVC